MTYSVLKVPLNLNQPQQNCAMVRRWQVADDFLGPAYPASHVQYISDLHSKFTPCVQVR